MRKIQATEAKAKFLSLLTDAERGESIAITRHGKVVAKLVPETSHRREEIREAIDGLENLRQSLPRTGISVQDILRMRHEGHRY